MDMAIDDDYEKIFGKKRESHLDKNQVEDGEEQIYEVGDNGVDISPMS